MKSSSGWLMLLSLATFGILPASAAASALEGVALATPEGEGVPLSARVDLGATLAGESAQPDGIALPLATSLGADLGAELAPSALGAELTPSTPDPLTATAIAPGVETEPWGQPILPDEQDLAQTPSVFGLTDVRPTDWAYQALLNLITNYGCLSGFPDGSFRGNQPVSRFEFAAGLSACLDQIANLQDGDIAVVARLQQEFANELTTRIEALEARIEELRGTQFSTTTRMFGQVIFGLQTRNENRADFNPVDGRVDTRDPSGGIVTFYSSAQLSLLSQFSPRSLLLVGLQAGSGDSVFDRATGNALGLTNDVRLAYETDTGNSLTLGDLTYRHLVSNNLALIVGAAGINPVGVFRGPNRFESAGAGPLSRFAQRNPILSIGAGQSGVGFDWQVSDRWSVQGVYAAGQANDPQFGVFGGEYTFGFQLTGSPSDRLNFSANYLYNYTPLGNLLTLVGDSQVAAPDPITGVATNLQTHAIGATLAYDFNPRFTLGGWAGYTTSREPGEPGSVQTINWMLFANFPDLLGPGHLGGIYLGQPPRITSSNLRTGINLPSLQAGGLGVPGGQPGTTIHLEAFYRRQITDNISITPGFIVIFSPAHKPASETIVIGALRTTFSF